METPKDITRVEEEGGRGKRKHVEVDAFQPENFNATADIATLLIESEPGRGTKLDELPAVKSSISHAMKQDLVAAYRFLYGQKNGFPQMKDMKTRLLQFSGYLPPLPMENYDDEKQEVEDEAVEVR
jgi:hypothetical protein